MLPDLTRLHSSQVGASTGSNAGSVPPLTSGWANDSVHALFEPYEENVALKCVSHLPMACSEEDMKAFRDAALEVMRNKKTSGEAPHIWIYKTPKHSSSWKTNNMYSAFTHYNEKKNSMGFFSYRPGGAVDKFMMRVTGNAPRKPDHVFTVGYTTTGYEENGPVEAAVGLGFTKVNEEGHKHLYRVTALVVRLDVAQRDKYIEWLRRYKKEVGVV